MLKKIFILLLAFGVPFKLFAQPKSAINHYSTEDGLSHDIITCMLKDSEGFMWFGSWDGINRFDGHNFVSFKSIAGDYSQINSNRIDQIKEDRYGFLWLRAYDGQIYRFNKKTEHFVPLTILTKVKLNTSFDRILTIEGNILWLSTFKDGLIAVDISNVAELSTFRYNHGNDVKFRLPNNKINFFFNDKEGQVWVGTEQGTVCLAKNVSGIYNVKSLPLFGKSFENFVAIAESERALYFATAAGNLIVYDKYKRTKTTLKLSNKSLNAMALRKNTYFLYITSSDGTLFIVDTATLHVTKAVYKQGSPLYSIFDDDQGSLWIEPAKTGVLRYDLNTNKFKFFSQPNDSIYSYSGNHFQIIKDVNGNIWTNMKGGGFGLYDKASDNVNYYFNKPNTSDRRFSNIVNLLYYDENGILWLRTDERGIDKIVFQPNEFKQYLPVNNWKFKSENDVRGLLSDRKNRLWVGPKNGKVYLYGKGKVISDVFINPPKDGIGMIYSMMQDSKGSIWIGTKNNGLYKADPIDKAETRYRLSHFITVPNDHSTISDNGIYALLEDKDGRIWIGTFDGGLNLLISKDNKLSFLRLQENRNWKYKSHYRKIRNLALDKSGRIWIASTEGLVILEFKDELHFNTLSYNKIPGNKSSLGNNDIQYIYKDAKDRMWLATSGGGLNLALNSDTPDKIKFSVFTTKNGLPSDYLLSCVEDWNGHLWIATQSGLSRFKFSTGQFQNYNSTDGVPNSSFSEASCQRMMDGSLVFGTIKGYLLFRPEAIQDHPINASMVLTNLQINNRDVETGSSDSILKTNINAISAIKLGYRQNNISIDYTVLDYRSENKPFYEYRLVGFDDSWRSNKNQRRATFTNLPPGNYTFEVRSINGDLYRNRPLKKLSITILPPPWLTWWAILIYFVAAVSIIEVVRRIVGTMLKLRQRIAVEQQLTELKTRFFTNISHELRTPLTLILNPIEALATQEKLSKSGMEYINIVRRNAGRMVRFLNQLLDLRKVQNGKAKLDLSRVEMISFIQQIGMYFADFGREKNISFEIISANDQLFAYIDAQKIETVIYNLIGNAYKFSPAGTTVKVQVNDQKSGDSNAICISVQDQGIGVPQEHLKDIFEIYYEGDHAEIGKALKGTGIGLALAKEFVELHGGNIGAKNIPGSGLDVSLTIFQEAASRYYEAGSAEIFIDDLDNLQIVNQRDKSVDSEHLPVLLLVEDNQDMCSFISTQLSSSYKVLTAQDGEEGLKKSIQFQPDLILSDVMMPKMDGMQMLDQLKNNQHTSHIPVVLLTARTAIESQIEALQYGADYYITKPFKNEFLLAAVGNLISQRRKLINNLAAGRDLLHPDPKRISITSKDEEFLKKVVQFVQEKMTDPYFNIETVAETVNMGRTTFYNKFKGLTQMPPVELVRNMRLERAKQYFDEGARNIAEVAYTVGFNDAKYFSSCFKAKYKVLPSAYVKTLGYTQ